MQTFKAGGPGGQNQNKRETAVRIIHKESGAVGEAREHREQIRNKKAAMQRMAASAKFRVWVNRKVLAMENPEGRVNQSMAPHNLLIEGRDKAGNWHVIG